MTSSKKCIIDDHHWWWSRSISSAIGLEPASKVVKNSRFLRSCKPFQVGGWPTPLKNDGVSNSWGDDIPNIWKVIIPSCSSHHQRGFSWTNKLWFTQYRRCDWTDWSTRKQQKQRGFTTKAAVISVWQPNTLDTKPILLLGSNLDSSQGNKPVRTEVPLVKK